MLVQGAEYKNYCNCTNNEWSEFAKWNGRATTSATAAAALACVCVLACMCVSVCLSCWPIVWLSIPGVSALSWYWIMGWTRSECRVAPVSRMLSPLSVLSGCVTLLRPSPWNRCMHMKETPHMLVVHTCWFSQYDTVSQTDTWTDSHRPHMAAHAGGSQWTTGQCAHILRLLVPLNCLFISTVTKGSNISHTVLK